MIVFDLTCANGHTFEEWFASRSEYEAKVADGSVPCPDCGETHVAKGLSAPRINGGDARPPAPCGVPVCGMCGCGAMPVE